MRAEPHHMITVKEQHDLANQHPVYLKGQEAADAAVERARKADRAKAERLYAKAEKLAEQARLLESATHRPGYGRDLWRETEDMAYWAARRLVAAEHGVPLQEVLDHEAFYYAEKASMSTFGE